MGDITAPGEDKDSESDDGNIRYIIDDMYHHNNIVHCGIVHVFIGIRYDNIFLDNKPLQRQDGL